MSGTGTSPWLWFAMILSQAGALQLNANISVGGYAGSTGSRASL